MASNHATTIGIIVLSSDEDDDDEPTTPTKAAEKAKPAEKAKAAKVAKAPYVSDFELDEIIREADVALSNIVLSSDEDDDDEPTTPTKAAEKAKPAEKAKAAKVAKAPYVSDFELDEIIREADVALSNVAPCDNASPKNPLSCLFDDNEASNSYKQNHMWKPETETQFLVTYPKRHIFYMTMEDSSEDKITDHIAGGANGAGIQDFDGGVYACRIEGQRYLVSVGKNYPLQYLQLALGKGLSVEKPQLHVPTSCEAILA